MSSVDRRLQMLFEGEADLERRLKSGDDGGTSGGMEARVAKLEADVSHLVKQVDKLASLPVEVASLRGDVKALDGKVDGGFGATNDKINAKADLAAKTIEALPTKDWITARLQIYVAIMAGVSAIAVAVTKFL